MLSRAAELALSALLSELMFFASAFLSNHFDHLSLCQVVNTSNFEEARRPKAEQRNPNLVNTALPSSSLFIK